MTRSLMPLEFGDVHVRMVEIDGEPWWVLTDVCQVLGLENVSKVASRLEDYQKDGVTISDPMGRDQLTTVINESGLYSVIFTSRKPVAKIFNKWVTTEVLPAIRKQGFYGSTPAIPQDASAARKDMATRFREELALFESNNDKRLRDMKVFSKPKVVQMEMAEGSMLKTLGRANTWMKLAGLGFDLPYILWGIKTLSDANDNPIRSMRKLYCDEKAEEQKRIIQKPRT